MRIARIATPLIALSLVIAACGGDDTPDAAADGLGLITSSALTVCTDAPSEPFEFQDENGEWTGFDMDLMRAIATEMGDLELAVTVQPFDGIWLAPRAGACDIVASAMTITEERQAKALFTDPYFDADQSLLVRASDADLLTSAESLTGKTVAVQTGTTGESYAAENLSGATVVSFDEPAAMFLALEGGQVDAILQDLPVNAERAIANNALALTVTFPTGEQYGFAVAEDNTALATAVNTALAATCSSGTYQEIFEKYFGSGN